MKIPLASNGLRQKDIRAAQEVLLSQNLTMGLKVKEFEKLMSEYLGVEHFIMVNSGSSANLAIIEALMRPTLSSSYLKHGDGVLVPAVAWPTTVWPIIQLGLVPFFVDVEPHTIAIDLEKARNLIAEVSGIKAIFPIHPLGYCIDHDEIEIFCKQNNLIHISDVCESLGSTRNGVHAGTTALASSFSFYFSHHITTMEGGGIATNSSEFADDIRAIRSHGWSRDRTDAEEWGRQGIFQPLLTQSISKNHLKFQFVSTGYNIRPMEIQAAIGIEQLKDLNQFVEKRRSTARAVRDFLVGTDFEVVDGGTLDSSNSDAHSWMLIPIRIKRAIDANSRKLIDSLLEKYEIESRPVLTGNFLNQPVMRNFSNFPKGYEFPVAEAISRNYFMVGAHPDLSESQIDYLKNSLRTIAKSL
jgi:CDP-6-deoxy-D-xylo-4-hexulose-3-dehydrase